jgi:predicted transglutaminase-like cysteine proteinase
VKLRSTGEHHLALVARIENADLVLDNLHAGVRDFVDTLADYQWLRIQSSAGMRSKSDADDPRPRPIPRRRHRS